jgi:high frequency lysogenization protein
MDIKNATLAFAGMFQAVELVHQTAYHGFIKNADEAAFKTSLNSVLLLNPDSTEAVYEGIEGVTLGLATLVQQLGYGKRTRSSELLRYIIGLHILERQLHKHPDLLKKITDGIEQVVTLKNVEREQPFDLTEHLANIYQNTLSTLDYRIHVMGKPHYLKNSQLAAQIRALLLAGVRSTVLWRQKGGGRLKVFFYRKKIIHKAQQLHRLVTET